MSNHVETSYLKFGGVGVTLPVVDPADLLSAVRPVYLVLNVCAFKPRSVHRDVRRIQVCSAG